MVCLEDQDKVAAAVVIPQKKPKPNPKKVLYFSDVLRDLDHYAGHPPVAEPWAGLGIPVDGFTVKLPMLRSLVSGY